MEMIRIIFFRRRISASLLRNDMHNDGTGKFFRPGKLKLGGYNVMPVDWAGIFNPEVGKHHLFRRNYVGHPPFDSVQRIIGEFTGFAARLQMLFSPT